MPGKIPEFAARLTKGNLNRFIAVALFFADQGDLVREYRNSRHGDDFAVFPDLGHIRFFSEHERHVPDKKISGCLRSFAQYNPLAHGSGEIAQKKRTSFSERDVCSHKTPEETLRRL
jgi:hypothetical protein